MRINPAGIQIYQQQSEAEKLQRMTRDNAKVKEAAEATVPQKARETERSLSSISVKANENISKDALSSEERAALDLLFSRFANNARFQTARQGIQPDDDVRPGQLIDIKV